VILHGYDQISRKSPLHKEEGLNDSHRNEFKRSRVILTSSHKEFSIFSANHLYLFVVMASSNLHLALHELLKHISTLDCKYPGTRELEELYDRVYEMIQETEKSPKPLG